MDKNLQIQYYILPPTFVYLNTTQIYFSGFINSNNNFNLVEVILNSDTKTKIELLPHYNFVENKFKKCAFIINLPITKLQLENEVLNIELNFKSKTQTEKIVVEAINVLKNIEKFEAKTNEEIAILLPTYNPNINSFKKQINSILNQTYQNFKIIIQDDSSDKTNFNEIKNFVAKNNKIVLLRNKENIGFYKNIENLLYKIDDTFKYICFADQDDEWFLYKLKNQINFIEKQKADLIYSNLKITNEKGKLISDTFWNNRSNHINNFNALIQNNCATGSTILFKQKLLKNVLPFPSKIGKVYHDHWLCAKTKSIANVKYQNKVLVNYIQHSNNVTGFHQFKKYSFTKRISEIISLLIVSLKVIFVNDLQQLEPVIKQNQKIYFVNFQRIKLFYFMLKNYKLKSSFSNLKILAHTLKLSLKTFSKKYFFNRSEVAIYSSIIFNFAINVRFFFKKK